MFEVFCSCVTSQDAVFEAISLLTNNPPFDLSMNILLICSLSSEFVVTSVCAFCRSIIPRSLSSTFQTGSPMISSMSSDSIVDLSFRPNLKTDLMCYQSEKQKDKKKVTGNTGMEPYDLTTIFFCKVGSSFNQLQNPTTKIVTSSRVDTSRLPRFKEAAIRNIFNMIQDKFLNHDLIQFLDNLANDIYVTNEVKVFPYKSFSETLHLVLMSLLRELLLSQPDLAPVFINEIHLYVKKVLESGRVELNR